MKTRVLSVLIMSSVLSLSGVSQEKEKRFGFELSGGVSIATSKPGDASLQPGAGFEGIFHYRFMPHTGLYGGWGWNRLGADNSFAGENVCFEETGYILGIQFIHPLGDSPLSIYLRAAGLFNHIEIEDGSGDIIYDTGHGLGWQVAGGIEIPMGSKWSFTPGLKYNSIKSEVADGDEYRGINHRYIMLRAGFLRKF